MRVERYECDVCSKKSNGSKDGWFAVVVMVRGIPSVEVCRLKALNGEPTVKWKHACGESCMLQMVADAMRNLP